MSRERLPVVGIGAAACLACCAPPILGALGLTVGLALVLWLAVGVMGAVAVLIVGAGVIRRRRRVAA